MSEFSKEDCTRWIFISVDKKCSLYKAIRYDLYFETEEKKTIAFKYLLTELGIEKDFCNDANSRVKEVAK